MNNVAKPTADNIKTEGLQVALKTKILEFVAANFKKTDLKADASGLYQCSTELENVALGTCKTKLKELDAKVCATLTDCEKKLDAYIASVISSPKASGTDTAPQDNCQKGGTNTANCAQDLSTSTELKFSDLITHETADMTHDYGLTS